MDDAMHKIRETKKQIKQILVDIENVRENQVQQIEKLNESLNLFAD